MWKISAMGLHTIFYSEYERRDNLQNTGVDGRIILK
jgi:hypothetical protein